MPPPVPERDALIEARLAYAAAYRPRARRQASSWGIEWPERFEAAMWERLGNTLAIKTPYSMQ